MSNVNKCMVSKDSGQLQIPYADYVSLMEKVEEAKRIRMVKVKVIGSLRHFLKSENHVDDVVRKIDAARSAKPAAPKAAPAVPKAAPAEPKKAAPQAAAPKKPAPAPETKPEPAPVAPTGRAAAAGVEVPPIKKDISEHFNKLDESGRLFSVFKQYYTCLNDTCGGTVRVTMKDGFCSLWNYDEWEEFAFIDLFEGNLRVAVDPRYTDALQSLNFCEVPRLLSSRRKLVCVQVGDLNNTMLEVLVKAFQEVGLTAS